MIRRAAQALVLSGALLAGGMAVAAPALAAPNDGAKIAWFEMESDCHERGHYGDELGLWKYHDCKFSSYHRDWELWVWPNAGESATPSALDATPSGNATGEQDAVSGFSVR